MPQRRKASSRRRGAVAGATLLAFCAINSSVARAQDLSCGLGDVEVRALKFVGNKALTDDELALRVTTTPSYGIRRTTRLPIGAKRCLNRAYLPGDLAKLEVYYLERGYYSAQIDTAITPDGRGAVRVEFRIKEGPVTTVQSYQVRGLDGVADSASIIRNLRLRKGQPYDIGFLTADKDSIRSHLRNSGYYRAETFTRTNRVDSTLSATVEIDVDPGVRARFGKPQFHVTPLDNRAQQVPDAVVLGVAAISPGAYYSDRAITEAARNLYQLDIYRHVEVQPLPDSLQPPGDSLVVLDFRLSEDYMKRVDSESGLATLDCGRIRVQYTDQNFLHSARRLDLTGQASKLGFGAPMATRGTQDACNFIGQNALVQDGFSSQLHYFTGASYRQPRLLGTRWVPTLSLYSERRGEYKAYLRSTEVGTDVSATRDIADRTQLRVGYSQELGRTKAPDAVLCSVFSRCDDSSRVKIQNLATLGVASASVSRLWIDNLVNPTRGSILRAEVRSSASKYLGTSPSLFFNKASIEAAFFTPFGWGNVLSFRVRAGAVQSPGSFIPPQERLYAGGPNSIRGFNQNELGDVVYIARTIDVKPDTFATTPLTFRYHVNDTLPVGYERFTPLGGDRLIVGNLEYRVRDPFFSPNRLQYTFFVDAGDVWNHARSELHPKYTPGVGFRLSTPIGPVQMNFGINRYDRAPGPMYFEDPTRVTSTVHPEISPLYCVSPNNTIVLTLVNGVPQPPAGAVCNDYTPVQRKRWYQHLTITFQIGPDF